MDRSWLSRARIKTNPGGGGGRGPKARRMPLYLKRLGSAQTFDLPPDKDKIVIGRSLECDISFPSVHISRQHCQILRVPASGALIVKNLKNTNSTYIDELRLQNSEAFAELQVGCRIGLGVPLEHATVAGMRNSNFVFLELESSEAANETRQNSERNENQRNPRIGVNSQLGEPAYDATLPGHLPKVPTHVQGADAATLPGHLPKVPTRVQGADAATLPGHRPKVPTCVQGADAATLPGHSQQEATCVEGAAGNCVVSRQGNQVPMVHLQDLKLHLRDMSSGFLPTQRPCLTPKVDSSISIQDEMLHIPISASNALHVKGRVSQSGAGSKGELRHTRQPENTIENFRPYEAEPRKFEHPVAPVKGVNSNHEHKQGLSKENIIYVEADNSKIGKASVIDLVTKDEEPHSPISIDLTQRDPDSPINVDLLSDSSVNHELNECVVTMRPTDENVSNGPSLKRNSAQGEGEELSGKRKRFIHAEPSSGMSVTEESEECFKKKFKSSSSLYNDKNSDSKNEPQGWSGCVIEPQVHNIRTDKNSSKSDSNMVAKDGDDDEPLGHETKQKQNSYNVSNNSDDEYELFVHRRNINEDARKLHSIKNIQDRDSEPAVCKRKIKNSKRALVYQDLENSSSSDEDLIIIKRKNKQNPQAICSSDSYSDIEDIPNRKSGEKGDVPNRNRNRNRISGENLDLASLFNLKRCTVNVNQLSCDNDSLSVTSRDNSFLKGTSASTNKNIEKCRHKPPKKRINSVVEANISCEDKGEVMIDQTTIEQKDGVKKKSLDEHPSNIVSVMTSRDNQREAKSVPLLSKSGTSAATSISHNLVDSGTRNELKGQNKISFKCNFEESKKSNEESRAIKVEVPAEIKIKTEPLKSCEKNNNLGKDVFMYSQVGDEIWLSSDEEEASPSPSLAPTSPDADLLFLKEEEEEEEEQPSHMEVNGSTMKELAEMDGNDDLDKDDQWLPVLSQSFLQSSDEEEEKDEDGRKDSKDNVKDAVGSEPKPGPSGVNEIILHDESEDEIDEWWPVLSQGFFDEVAEEEEDKGEEMAASSNTELDTRDGDEVISSGSTTELQSVIQKLQKKAPRTSQLIDLKVPLKYSKKKSLQSSDSVEKEFYSKTKKTSTIVKKMSDDSKNRKQKQENLRTAGPVNKTWKPSKTQNQILNIRKTLTSRYNLEAYKPLSKEKHHLVHKDNEKSKKPPPDPQKPPPNPLLNKRMADCKTSENISIQKKAKSTDTEARPKVAAKVTKKTRFEKLLDVDLFSAPSKSKGKKNFRIPKACKSSTGAESLLVLNRKKDARAADRYDRPLLLDVTESQPENTSDNAHSERHNLPSSIANISNDPTDKVKGIFKGVKLKSSEPKKVRFPEKDDDLVKVVLISPRRKGERRGLPSVRASEMLPEELKLQRQNIPPYYMELFVHHVCRWNYDWLECYHIAQEKHRTGVVKAPPTLPPIVASTNYPMLVMYSSYNDYRETHSSLFYIELWERIYKDWMKSTTSGGLPSLIEFVKPAFISTQSGVMKFWAIKLMVAIPQNKGISVQNFRQGTLISLKIRKETKRRVIFGYVDHMVVNNRSMATPPQNSALAQMGPNFTLGVRVVKKIIETVNPGTVITITNISYIRPCSRVWECLQKLPLSPLCKDILSPTPAAFSCESKIEKYLVKDLPLNEAQMKAVTKVSSKCMFNSHIPKLSLIHGPPGTGKTSTIVALIAQLAMIGNSLDPEKMPRCRVLVCAPSNAAVDELTLRLVSLRDIGLSLRVVRVGFKANNHPVVRNYTLDQFVNKKVTMELSTPKCESARQELQRRKVLVEQVAEDLEKARKEGRQNERRELEVRLNEVARSKAELEKSFNYEPSVHEKHQLHQKWQQEFLLNAEVVTTTLNSCVSGSIAEVLSRHPHHFTCCIVDEAGQCQETETLLPLLLGIKKLVLVGDHHQLPATVLSQLALSKNLKQSLFERLHHRLVLELQREDVVHMLNVQYRMHPQIVEWPAHHFYHNKLVSEKINQPSTALKPYMIFDLKTSQERQQNLEMYNPAEASLVCVLLQVMQPHLSGKTVGIITPYQRQRIYLQEKLTRFIGKIDICINTIDGFQGQERDVIILSFVRANDSASIGFLSQRQRLNVALTRAKQVCYIVASLSSLDGNREWHSLIRNGRQRGVIYTVTSKEENDRNFLKGAIEN